MLLLGCGVAITGLLPTFSGIVFTTLLMSFGFHYFETTNQSLTLQYFDKQQAPLVFGRLRSMAAATCVIISGTVFLLAPVLDYRELYLVFGGAIIITCLWMITRDPTERDVVPQHKRMIVKRKYWLYYALTFLAGARRQIFIAFAVFSPGWKIRLFPATNSDPLSFEQCHQLFSRTFYRQVH